jgi:hypothetical protein
MSEFIQKIPLFFNATKEVMAELRKGFPIAPLECWKSFWIPSLDAYLKSGKKRPEHAHWNWSRKTMDAIFRGKEDCFFWIDCQAMTQGIMLVDQGISYLGEDFGKKNIYVDFLQVAPWNYFKDCAVGYYQGVGSILLMAAINYSHNCGFDGRIALESLPQSENFYLNKKMVPAVKPSGQSPLKYFELPTRTAQEVLKGMKQ